MLQSWLKLVLEDFPGLGMSLQLRLRKNVITMPRGDELLEAIDAALTTMRPMLYSDDYTMYEQRAMWKHLVDQLQERLQEADSVWRISDDRGELETRVDDTVHAAAQAVMHKPYDAAAHLQKAWTAAYAFRPDPSLAYSEAVKAVEAAVIPLTLPNAGTPTLGSVLSHLEGGAASKYTLVIDDKVGAPASASAVTALMRVLWDGHRDRHPGGGTSKPITLESARAAVQIAVTVVHLFSSGAVVKMP